MTSEQIRQLRLSFLDTKTIRIAQASMLREIAAQLAEMNENYTDFKKMSRQTARSMFVT